MLRGIYSAATGMLVDQYVQDSIAGNLANLNTVGYKQDTPSFGSLQEMALNRYETDGAGTPIGSLGLGATLQGTRTDMSQGALNATGNNFDLGLTGTGLFSVQTAQGVRYTRDGQFHITMSTGPDGKPAAYLADVNGDLVLGQNGPINIAVNGAAKEVAIGDDGSVKVDGVVIDHLKLVDAPDGTFHKQGSNLFYASGAVTQAPAQVHSGYLEEANISAVGGLVRMITVQRAYDAAQKAITSQDDELNKVITEVGKT